MKRTAILFIFAVAGLTAVSLASDQPVTVHRVVDGDTVLNDFEIHVRILPGLDTLKVVPEGVFAWLPSSRGSSLDYAADTIVVIWNNRWSGDCNSCSFTLHLILDGDETAGIPDIVLPPSAPVTVSFIK